MQTKGVLSVVEPARFPGAGEDFEAPVEKGRLAARLESLLQGLPAGVLLLDGAGFIRQANPAAEALLGTPLVGVAWREVIARAFAPNPQAGCDLRLASGRLVNLSTCPLGGEPGQILLLNDVTETRMLQERANRDQRLTAMGRMVASLAHQIRTPLSSALLYVSHMKRPELNERKRLQLADKILGRLRRLERLLDDMLTFAHGGLGGGELLSAGELLTALRELVKPQLEEAEIVLAVTDETEGEKVRCNRELLLSALQNLVTNAIQAMEGKGRIEIAAQRRGESVMITVADDGPGIAPELRARVFEPFVTSRSGGTGLGLAVARAVAQAHQGDLEMESEAGRGTVFRLRLPVVEPGCSGAK